MIRLFRHIAINKAAPYLLGIVLSLAFAAGSLYLNSLHKAVDNSDAGISTAAISSTLQPSSNAVVLQPLERDLYGDNRRETIVLYHLNQNGWPSFLSLVVDGTEKASLKLEDGYTTGRLEFEDLDNDRVGEVLLYQCCTGSSGAALLDVYRPSRGAWQRIFAAPSYSFPLNNDQRYAVKYIGNYQVSFTDGQTGLKSIIQLNREMHKGMEGQLEHISTWVDPIAEYIFKDIDGDGVKEIIAVQRVIGVSHPDTIAELRTTYKLENGQYRPITLSLTTPRDPQTGEGQLLSVVRL